MGIFDRFRAKPAEPPAPQQPPAAQPPVQPPPQAAAEVRVDAPILAEETTPKGGLWSRLKSGLRKTTQLLNTDIRDLFKREGRLVDDAFLSELYSILIKTDLGVKAAKEIVAEIRASYWARIVGMHDVLGTVKSKLKDLLAQDTPKLAMAQEGPTVLMVCGVNGSGKTTSIAKLAQHFRAQGKKVVLGAADTFRAAAVEQLTVWAGRVGAEIVTGPQGSDPASVAHRAVAQALETAADVCIVDTAGRLQTQRNLMQELSKIHRVIQKQIPDGPHEVILVLDATAGQNGISQAQGFTEAVACTGIFLAKLDGTAKGGVVVPIRQQFSLPVKFVGLGEKPEDLAWFDANSFVDALFEDIGENEPAPVA
ncbi:MAG: signal recognition particle-docking protein FtsY [Pirellulales bacterium]